MEVAMPVITGEGDDGVVTAWMVDDGGFVEAGQLIAEVQAEKVAEEVRAPIAGIVRDRISVNQPVPQGQPICRITESETEPVPSAASVAAATPAPSAEPAGRPPSSPAARRLARELNVDLVGLAGSGPDGRITEADVRAAAGHEVASQQLTGLRAVIARNMRESVRTTAPVTLTTTVDVTDSLPSHITAWIVRTTAVALTDHPALNGTRDGDRFVPGARVDVNLAIQTDEGLTAPVIRAPASKSITDLADEIGELAARARAKQLGSADFEGGTFSVTNLGAFGVDAFTPIINPPQVAILGVGAVRAVAGVEDGRVVPRRHLTLSLTFDHSFVDGAPAAAFLRSLTERLEG